MRAPTGSMASFYTPAMVPALLLVLGCWRPDAYTPPAAPPEEAPVDAPDDAPEEAREGTPEDAPDNVGGEADDAPTAAEGGEEDAPPPFANYAARTLQAPVTLVDDYGKPLVVISTAGIVLEVRGEDDVRTRVWCGSCTPAVEGWIQAHLLERTNASPTGGSK